jgi:hypothetical protein
MLRVIRRKIVAEERLTDTDLDKDKKYRIRKNSEGEDELEVDEEAEEEEVEFTVPTYAYDVENAENMSPNEFEQMMKAREEEEQLKKQQIEEHLQEAQKALEQGEFETVLYQANVILSVDENNAEALSYKMRALSRNFSDLIELSACAEVAELLADVATPEQKAALKSEVEPFYLAELDKRKAKAQELGTQNEAKKADRRVRFLAQRKKALTKFLIFAVPFVVFLALAIGFACVITARENGLFVIMTAVWGGLAVVTLVGTVIFSRGLVDAQRKVNLNEKDSSTKLGRELLAVEDEISMLERILGAVTVSETQA